jgi:hypothetical protein
MVCLAGACAICRAAPSKAPLVIYIEAGKIDPIGQRTDSGRGKAKAPSNVSWILRIYILCPEAMKALLSYVAAIHMASETELGKIVYDYGPGQAKI